MVIKISQRLGLAQVGERFFYSLRAQRVAGIEVTEFAEYSSPKLCADARELLASSYARAAQGELSCTL